MKSDTTNLRRLLTSTTRELPVQFGKCRERTVSRTGASTSNKRSRLSGPYFL